MSRAEKGFLVLCRFLLLIVFIFCFGACHREAAEETGPEPIRIGHSAALTGGSGLWGQSERNALELAVEKINTEGGVLGRPLELIAYDNKAENAEGVNVANRLVADGVIAVIGPAQSGVAIASSGVTEEAGVILIATTATNEKLTVPREGEPPLPFTFRTCFIDPYQGAVAADFAYHTLGVRRAGILKDVGSDSSTYLARYFTQAFEALGGEVVADEAFRSEELEYKAQLSKIQAAKAELLFIPTMQKEAGLAMKQARELGMDCQFLGGDAWASEELVALGGTATEGGFFVNIASLEDPVIADWVTEYEERFGQNPVMPNPVLAVDALYALVEGIRSTGSIEPAVLAGWLAQCQDVPVLTGTLTMDPQTHNPVGRTAVIETIQNGEFVFYQNVE